jgi:hypothetical protein
MRSVSAWLLSGLVAASLAGSACVFEQTNDSSSSILGMSPSAIGTAQTPLASQLVGLWSSAPDSTGNCTNFQWNVTSQIGTSVTGTFSALCANQLVVTGTATGQLNGTTVAMQLMGTGTMPGVSFTCECQLSGTGQLQGDNTLLVTYTGTTCLGPLAGQIALQRPS